MATETSETSAVSPDDAFSMLGNSTRMEILRALGTTDEPLSFSELHDRVEMSDSGQFNYHLDTLTDHFVRHTDDGYDLRQAGRRVIEAVLSGAVTDAPEVALEHIDESCPYCGATIAVAYREERVRIYCTSCDGTYDDTPRPESIDVPAEYGYLGNLLIPPAGVQDRTPEEVFEAASTWANLEVLAMASGVCPRCSAPIEHSKLVCEDHDASDGLCEQCNRRHVVNFSADCTNCNYGHLGGFALVNGTETALLSFLLDHGINPVSPDSSARRRLERVHQDYDEEVLESDPFAARFTFTVDGAELTLTVDDELTVVDVA